MSIVAESIKLPMLLVVSLQRDSTIDVTNDEVVDVGNLTYELIGVAFYRPGHYTCAWRLGDRWYYYDDTADRVSPTTGKAVPKGYTRRLMYYVRTERSATENFDGERASKDATYSISAHGGVCQQEGTAIMK
jgi:ubiquitin C-terminal hydrolase